MLTSQRRFFLASSLLLLSPSTTAHADMTIDCAFTTRHVTLLEKGKAVDQAFKPTDGFTMTFTGFDLANSTVKVVGSLGASDALFDLDKTRLMILERTETGNIMVTTMETPSDAKFVYGIHTRHSWIGPAALISTMSGPCTLR